MAWKKGLLSGYSVVVVVCVTFDERTLSNSSKYSKLVSTVHASSI